MVGSAPTRPAGGMAAAANALAAQNLNLAMAAVAAANGVGGGGGGSLAELAQRLGGGGGALQQPHIAARLREGAAALLNSVPGLRAEDCDDPWLAQQLAGCRSEEEALAVLRCAAGAAAERNAAALNHAAAMSQAAGMRQHMAHISQVGGRGGRVRAWRGGRGEDGRQVGGCPSLPVAAPAPPQAIHSYQLGQAAAAAAAAAVAVGQSPGGLLGSSPPGSLPLRAASANGALAMGLGLPGLAGLVGGPPGAGALPRSVLQKLPLRVYRRLEEAVAQCPHLEWKHFDAGVVKVGGRCTPAAAAAAKATLPACLRTGCPRPPSPALRGSQVMAQLAEICEEDVFEELVGREKRGGAGERPAVAALVPCPATAPAPAELQPTRAVLPPVPCPPGPAPLH